MKLSSRDMMIAVVAGIVVLAILFVVFAIVPQFSALTSLGQSTQKADADIQAAEALLVSRQQAKQQAVETQAELTRLDNEIPDAPELPALIIDLQDTANDAGVVMDGLMPGKPSDPVNGYQKIALQFNVQGQWDDVVDYLRRLGDLTRGVRVLSADISQPKASVEGTAGAPTQAGEEKVNLSVETYMLPRNVGGASAPSAGP